MDRSEVADEVRHAKDRIEEIKADDSEKVADELLTDLLVRPWATKQAQDQ